MEEKKSFGAFILQRRRELGLTQKEFAQMLYVTESAVSKWERGLSYPDITLLRDICRILQITEHELLTGNEDTQRRASEHLAQKYLRLMRNFRLVQILLYGCALIGCAIGNFCAQGTLSWFFIAATAVMTSASLTLLPAILSMYAVQFRGIVVLSSFTASLLLLLLSSCLYSGGTWFAVAAVSVLLGLSLLFLPYVLRRISLPDALARRTASIYLLSEVILLVLLLLTSCIYSQGDWFAVATVATVFGLLFFLLPVFFRQIPVRRHRPLLYCTIQTIGLALLLYTADRFSRAGLFWSLSLPVAASVLLLVWVLLLSICYIPANRLLRGAISCLLSSAWLFVWPNRFTDIMTRKFGVAQSELWPLVPPFALHNWTGQQAGYNVLWILVGLLVLLSVLLGIAGALRAMRNKKKTASL